MKQPTTKKVIITTTKIDTIPIATIAKKFSALYNEIEPEIIYIPFAKDVHSDHQIISSVIQSTLKWFRYPSIKKILMYETISETDYNFLVKHEDLQLRKKILLKHLFHSYRKNNF